MISKSYARRVHGRHLVCQDVLDLHKINLINSAANQTTNDKTSSVYFLQFINKIQGRSCCGILKFVKDLDRLAVSCCDEFLKKKKQPCHSLILLVILFVFGFPAVRH